MLHGYKYHNAFGILKDSMMILTLFLDADIHEIFLHPVPPITKMLQSAKQHLNMLAQARNLQRQSTEVPPSDYNGPFQGGTFV